MTEILGHIYKWIDIILPFEPFSMVFMKRALLGILLLSPICAAMGVQVVSFGMAFYSDAISHSAFTGVALGLIFSVNPTASMIIFGLFVGWSITKVRRNSELSNDTVVGVFFSFVVALGIVIISARKGLTQDLQNYLYGNILTIDDIEIVFISVMAVFIIVFLAVSYNGLILLGLNRSLAQSRMVPAKHYDYMFSLLLALVVTVTIRAVGLLLVTAMLVAPAAAGRNMAKNQLQMFWWAISISVFSGFFGLTASYYWDSAAGASIILVVTAVFLLTQLYSVAKSN